MRVVSEEQRRQEWLGRVMEWEKSGKTMKAWCRENDIVYSTFFYWKTRLLSKSNLPEQASFIEITEDLSNESGIVIEYQNVVVKVSKNFDILTLSRCIQLLREMQRC